MESALRRVWRFMRFGDLKHVWPTYALLPGIVIVGVLGGGVQIGSGVFLAGVLAISSIGGCSYWAMTRRERATPDWRDQRVTPSIRRRTTDHRSFLLSDHIAALCGALLANWGILAAGVVPAGRYAAIVVGGVLTFKYLDRMGRRFLRVSYLGYMRSCYITRCQACDHEVVGAIASTCPECGEDVTGQRKLPTSRG